MEKVVHIIMGAIGTGKSYLADILAKQNGISILSADQIEFENKDLKEQDIEGQIVEDYLTYIIHSGFISGYQNRYGDNLKPPTNVYHRMTA